jgi:hypothetical protein
MHVRMMCLSSSAALFLVALTIHDSAGRRLRVPVMSASQRVDGASPTRQRGVYSEILTQVRRSFRSSTVVVTRAPHAQGAEFYGGLSPEATHEDFRTETEISAATFRNVDGLSRCRRRYSHTQNRWCCDPALAPTSAHLLRTSGQVEPFDDPSTEPRVIASYETREGQVGEEGRWPCPHVWEMTDVGCADPSTY